MGLVLAGCYQKAVRSRDAYVIRKLVQPMP
jgi:hypothetical protein